MVGIGKKLLGFLSGSREWLTLLAVASAAAFLWWKFHQVQSERDALKRWSEVACAQAGSDFRATPGAPGSICRQAIITLAKFRTETIAASNAALSDDIATREQKAGADLVRARAAAADARRAAELMEKANAAIGPDGQVGPAWFDAVNRAAGLRPTGTEPPGGGGGHATADPAR